MRFLIVSGSKCKGSLEHLARCAESGLVHLRTQTNSKIIVDQKIDLPTCARTETFKNEHESIQCCTLTKFQNLDLQDTSANETDL